MCKNYKRAERRFHRARMLKRTINKIKQSEYDPQQVMLRAARMYDNMAICSCSMCGNQRGNKWFNNNGKLSMQERRAVDNYNDNMEEINVL